MKMSWEPARDQNRERRPSGVQIHSKDRRLPDRKLDRMCVYRERYTERERESIRPWTTQKICQTQFNRLCPSMAVRFVLPVPSCLSAVTFTTTQHIYIRKERDFLSRLAYTAGIYIRKIQYIKKIEIKKTEFFSFFLQRHLGIGRRLVRGCCMTISSTL